MILNGAYDVLIEGSRRRYEMSSFVLKDQLDQDELVKLWILWLLLLFFVSSRVCFKRLFSSPKRGAAVFFAVDEFLVGWR